MKKLVLIIIGLVLTGVGISQNTLVLQPGPSTGKDALLQTRYPSNNFGNSTSLIAAAWPYGQNQIVGITSSIFQFNLSQLPMGVMATSAKLNLYKDPNSQQQGHSGDNGAYIKRVLFDWSESTVTYYTQPMTTDVNMVELAPSKDVNQNYLDIDVTQLVNDMIANPYQSFGFLLNLITEERSRSLVFASSDNSNPNLRPKLVIQYQYVIRGHVTYSNTASTPLPGVNVDLYDANNLLKDSKITNENGDFTFFVPTYGNYKIVPGCNIPVNGFNSHDALIALKHFTGLALLDGLVLKAADIDDNGVVNSIDAVNILYRFIGRIDSFPAGNWVFENPVTSVPSPGYNIIQIKGLCIGDLNASWRP